MIGNSCRNRRVLVVYQHLAHYRYGVFHALEAVEGLDVKFLADTSSRDGSIRTIDPTMLRQFTRVRNVWLGRFLFQRGLMREMLASKPDVVIFLGDYSYVSTWLGALLARAVRSRVIFWTIGWHKPDVGLTRIIRLAFYTLADALLLYGRTAKEIGTNMGYPAERMFVVGNSDVSSLSAGMPSSEGLEGFVAGLPPAGSPCLGAVIRLNESKELHLIIEAAALIRERGTPVSVLLVGQGPSQEYLAGRADELSVPIYFPGPAYTAIELQYAYARISVCVIPSVAGLATIQALRHGTPVITHNDAYAQAPEFEAIIPGQNGDLYERHNVMSLSLVAEDWLRRVSADQEIVARTCRESTVNAWSPESQVRAILDAMGSIGIVTVLR